MNAVPKEIKQSKISEFLSDILYIISELLHYKELFYKENIKKNKSSSQLKS